MKALPDQPTLPDYQEYIAHMIEERGFSSESLSQKFLLFLEECGEMAKAARKLDNIHYGDHSSDMDIGLEAADVFIYLIEICNMTGVDLEEAFIEKEKINQTRVWKRSNPAQLA